MSDDTSRVREQAYKDWKNGMKYKEIAEKYGVSLSAVKSWAARYWNKNRVATEKPKKSQPSKPQKPKKRHTKSGGAPLGNKNRETHGGYSAVYLDALEEGEADLIDLMPADTESMLLSQIEIYTIREVRILNAIKKVKEVKGGLVPVSTSSIKQKRVFDRGISEADKQRAESDRDLYWERIDDKVASGDRLPGQEMSIRTDTEASYNVILRLEAELTRVQRQKTEAIRQLAVIQKQKAEAEGAKDSLVEDWIAGVVGGDSS